MGDQAVNIVQRVKALMKEPSHAFDLPVDAMTDTVEDMVALSLEALVNQDPIWLAGGCKLMTWLMTSTQRTTRP